MQIQGDIKLPLISVVVPIYNVELYLRECIDSILAQTYTNLEIILVNDGSPDNCGAICDEYAEQDDRIVVIHKQNGGLSDARNAGIEVANGEYLTFVDSDDWIDADMLELLYNNLIVHEADISCCSYYYSYLKSNVPAVFTHKVLTFTAEQAITQILLNKYENLTVMACGKLYKKYIFQALRYPVGKIHEDEFIIIDILSKTKCIVSDLIPKYYYRQRKGSIMGGVNNIVYSAQRANDIIEAFGRRMIFIKEKHFDMYEMSKIQFLGVNLRILCDVLMIDGYRQTPVYKKILSTIKSNFKYIVKSNFATQNIKIAATAVKINPALYKAITHVYLWRKRAKNKEEILFD